LFFAEQSAAEEAAKPAQTIDKGLPGPGLLANVAVSKYLDHLPLHRQERIFTRHGVKLGRSTLCDWMQARQWPTSGGRWWNGCGRRFCSPM